MSDAERDPHVLISARIGTSQKILGLPSHRARWGWIVMLGQAKLQHPPGRFESFTQVRAVAWEFRDCIAAWQDAGLLHVAETACARCRKAFGFIGPAEVVVHDFREHQERKSRTTEWRQEKGIASGHDNLPEATSGNNGETTGKHGEISPLARAHAGALQSLSLSKETSSPSRAPEDSDDCLDTYYRLTRFRPWGIWSGDKLIGAAREYGDEAVTVALRAEHALDVNKDTLMDRSFARLAKEADRAKRDKPKAPKAPKPARDEAAYAEYRERISKPGATA